jgi:hypothetical protein
MKQKCLNKPKMLEQTKNARTNPKYLVYLSAQIHDSGDCLWRGAGAVHILKKPHDVGWGKEVCAYNLVWTLCGTCHLQHKQ